MPSIIREGDRHIGHASPTPNPFHSTPYQATHQGNVYVNGKLAIVKGDSTACGDAAVGSSSSVYINNILVHRTGDATSGHQSWVPTIAADGSPNTIVGN